MEIASTQLQSPGPDPDDRCTLVKLKALMEAVDIDRSCRWEWVLADELEPGTYTTLKRVFDGQTQVVWHDRGMCPHPTIAGKKMHQLRLLVEKPWSSCWIPADLDIAVCVYKYFKMRPEFLPFFHTAFNYLFDIEFFKKDRIYRGSPIMNKIYFKAPHDYLMEVEWDIPRFFLYKTVNPDKIATVITRGPYALNDLVTVWHEVMDAEAKKDKAERKRKKESATSESSTQSEATEKRSKETQTRSESMESKVSRVPNYFLKAKDKLSKEALFHRQVNLVRASQLQEWLDAIPIETDSNDRGTLPVISIVNEVDGVIQAYRDAAKQHDPEGLRPLQIRQRAWEYIKKDCFTMECRAKAGQLMRMLMNMVFEGNYDSIQEAWELADALGGLEDAKRIMLELKRLDRIAFPDRDKTGARVEPASPSPNIPV